MNILVTGARSGFGAAMVNKFASLGHRVVAVARREDRLKNLANTHQNFVYSMPLDISNSEDVHHKLSTLPDDFKNIDVLINNAGLALGIDPAQKSNLSDWQTMVDVNIKGLLNCTHHLLPLMVKRNQGHIINLGSVAGEFPYPGGNVYGATKAFVHQFSLNLRADLLGTNVRVTCVEPGICSGTEFSSVRFKGDEQKAESVYKGVTAISPEDIAETVYWIVSQPTHVNINTISMMPTQQAFSALAVHRK
jgi:3-hydroxy acid dehydrogenase/malonic semialdehyde reductase